MLGHRIYSKFIWSVAHGLCALIPMVQMPKELALLGGSFLIGLGALEVCLRFGGF